MRTKMTDSAPPTRGGEAHSEYGCPSDAPPKLIARLKGPAPWFIHRKSTLLRNGPVCKIKETIKETGGTSDVPVMLQCVQSGWARWWHRLQTVRVKREHNASDTRAKRGDNAKSNAGLTRTNAGGWHGFQPVRADYAFHFRELLPDRERNSENYYPALVNSELASRPCGGALEPSGRGYKRMDYQRSSVFICGLIGFFSQLLTGGAESRLNPARRSHSAPAVRPGI
jgi:hypothetical protein